MFVLVSSYLPLLFMLLFSRINIHTKHSFKVVIIPNKTKTIKATIFHRSFQQLLSFSTSLRQGHTRRRIILTPDAICYKTLLCENNRHIPKCNSFSDWSKIGRGGGGGGDGDDKYHYINDKYNRVMIAIGSNLGNRFTNLHTALQMLKDTNYHDIGLTSTKHSLSPSDNNDNDDDGQPLIQIIQTSFLRETPPMYVTDQPSFLNGAVEIETKLSPHQLLKRLKDIESKIGRDLDSGIKNGPRPIDLDIIYFGIVHNENKDDGVHGGIVIQSEKLLIPHPRIMEREFVLSPLCDIGKDIIHPSMNVSSTEMLTTLLQLNNDQSNECNQQEQQLEPIQVLPLPRGRMLSFNQTLIMGILNVTPDSFSDGGNYQGSVDVAVQQALQLVVDGADIIDIGGESTRPGAKEVDIDLELSRTIPVIEKIREG